MVGGRGAKCELHVAACSTALACDGYHPCGGRHGEALRRARIACEECHGLDARFVHVGSWRAWERGAGGDVRHRHRDSVSVWRAPGDQSFSISLDPLVQIQTCRHLDTFFAGAYHLPPTTTSRPRLAPSSTASATCFAFATLVVRCLDCSMPAVYLN